jgi:ferredoxin
VKITVDQDRCVGSAYCQRIAPATFDLGDDGLAFVIGSDAAGTDAAGTDAAGTDATAAVREAEAACPSTAISVLEA